ncbi:MAG: VTT domain-containing protein [Myxococcales bacterium]|nr:VTT domain-containing protein [Myxococcales bacterium]MCB9712278.1 VTT domain-containing protein [Myxococcales bacterium]
MQDQGQGDADASELRPRRLIVGTVIALLGVLAIVAALGLWFREPLLSAGRWFVQTLGGPGIAVGFAIPDGLTVPIPNDAFLALGRAGQMGTVPIVGWALLGSLCGGSLGWLIGRRLRRIRGFHRFMSGRGAALDRALRRHGLKVVAVAAITPLPYSLSAWAAGSSQVPYLPFLAVSLLRVVRIVAVLYLIDLGLMSVT